MADDMQLQIELMAQNNSAPEFSALDDSVKGVKSLVGELTDAIKSFSLEVKKSMESAVSAIKSLTDPLKTDKMDVNELRDAVAGVGDTAKSASDVASKNMQQLKDKVKEVKDTVVATEDELRKLTDVSKLKNVSGGAVDAASLSASQLKILYAQQTGKNVLLSGGGESKHGGGIFSNEGSMNLMYGGMTLGAASLPIDAGLKSAISTFSQFDQSVANTNTMLGYTPQQINQLKQQLMDLSKVVPQGPGALADALYGVVGAGVPAADAMGFLKVASEAATAGQTDVGTSTQALIAVLDSYHLKASDVTKVSDEMFAANAAGAMTFQQFASSLGTVAGAASVANVPFDQVAAATAALTNTGLSAQRSTQGLRALLMGIVAPTAGASKEAKKLGIEWDANTLKQKGLTGAIQEAMTATHGNAQELKKLIPNIAAWTAAVDLGSHNSANYKQAMQVMQDSSGATAQAMKAQMQGFQEQMDKAKASVQRAQIAFAGTLAPAIEKVANDVSKLAAWFANLNPGVQKFIGYGAAAAATLLTLGGGALLFLSGIGQAKMGLNTLKELPGIAKSIEGASKAFGLFRKGIVSAFSGLLDIIMANPIAAVIVGIVAVVAIAAYEIYKHWDTIHKWLENIWGAISKTATTVWNAITAFFKKWGVDILAAVLPVIGIPILIAQHWQQIEKFARDIWNSVVKTVQDVWNAFIGWITGAAQTVANAVVDAFSWMYNHNYFFKDLVDFVRNSWQTIQNDATAAWKAITQFLTGLWNGIVKVATDVWNGIVTALSAVWAAIEKTATTFWNAEVTGWTKIWNGIVKVFTSILTPIEKIISDIWSAISSTASTMWGGIKSTMSGLWNGIVGDAETIFNGLGKWFTGLWTQAEQWGANIIHMVAHGITKAAHEVEQAVSGVAHSIASFLGFHSPTKKGPGSDADTWMPNMMNMFVQGIQSNIPNLQHVLGSVLASPLSISGVRGTVQAPIMAYGGGMGGGYQGGQGMYVDKVIVQGTVIREGDLTDIVSRGLLAKAKMQGKT